jgi:N-acetylglucosaminyl-diphospho-decaprenol L-rhamnosyltransferase
VRDVSVDVVIVNWNAGRQLADCLAALAASTKGSFAFGRVVVVDNASSDGSVDDLHGNELPLSVIRNHENRGFGAACNQGAEGSEADYLLFLNPDARVAPDSLDRAVSLLRDPAHGTTGICGIQLVDETGHVSRSCARAPTPRHFLYTSLGLDRFSPRLFASHAMAEWDHLQSRAVDHVIGAFFLVRGELFRALNGFDERFFVYLEDLDFSARAKKSGFGSYYLTEARAYHKGGGTSERVKAARLFYATRSRVQYAYKHFPRTVAMMVTVPALLIEPFIRIAFAAARGRVDEISEVIEAYRQLYRWLPSGLGDHDGPAAAGSAAAGISRSETLVR